MSEKKVKFRSAVGGYNKEDVNSYIEMLSARYYETEFENQKLVTELKKRIKELEDAEAERLKNDKTDEIYDSLEKSERLIVELNDKLDSLNAEKDALIKENAELKTTVSELEKGSLPNEELIEKSNKYDQVSEQIGSMLISAEARAGSIVSESEIKAKAATAAMVDSAYEKLAETNEKYINGIVTKTVKLTEELRALCLEANEFCGKMSEELEEDKIKVREALECSKRVVMEDTNE